jgi:hypothetical protein
MKNHDTYIDVVAEHLRRRALRVRGVFICAVFVYGQIYILRK